MTPSLPAADHKLTDAEIDALYGDLLREGVAAFRADATYLAEMMEAFQTTLKRRRAAGVVEFVDAAEPTPTPEPPKPDPLAERNARIVKWRQTGATVYEIGQEFGLSHSGVEHVLKKEAPELLGKRVKSQRYEQRKERIVRLREAGRTLKEISEIVGTQVSTVSLTLQEAGLGTYRGSLLPPEERAARDQAIREAEGTISDIARQFGLSRAHIRNIRNQESQA